MNDPITSYYRDRSRQLTSNDNVIRCMTCYYRGISKGCQYAKINKSEKRDVFDFCLKDIPCSPSEFVHHRFPNHYRPNMQYQYICWEPKYFGMIKKMNLLLTDGDFEL